MLVPGDLGFRVAVLFIFVVFPAIGFVLRRKWRLSVARREEINRLLVLASEEAARAELEASLGYSASFSASSQRLCAVCFTPAPNRCARCKSVNYCSGKCQIIHWRQGHKDECCPPPNSSQINDEEVGFVGNAVKQPYADDYVSSIEHVGIRYDEQVETAPEKPGFTRPAYSPPVLSVKDDNNAVHHPLPGEEPDSFSELHGISEAPQFRASFSGNGVCIDHSISNDDSLHNLNSDSCDSLSSFESFDNIETASSDGNPEQTMPLEEELCSRVESSGNISASGDPKEAAPGKTTVSSGLSISHCDKNSAEPSISTSDFWDGSLDSRRTRKYMHNDVTKQYVGSGDKKFSDSSSSRQFFNFSGDLSSKLHSQGSEASGDTYPGTSRTDKPVVGPTLPYKDSTDATSRQSSTILSSEKPVTRVKEANSDGDLMKSEDVGTTGENSKCSNLPFCISEKAKDLGRNSKGTAQLLGSKNAGMSLKVPSYPSSPVTKGHISPAMKFVKAGGIATVPPQVIRSTTSATVGLKTSMLKVVEQFRAPRLSKEIDGVGKNIEKAIYPYEWFVKLYHWKVELRPCGLINCGNSCYANAVLQCLAFTPPLTAYLLQGLHSKACAKKEWCFTCEFERLILKAKESGSPLSPVGILSQIQKIGSHLANGREEDAHEFLRYAVDTMQSICLQEAGVNASGSLQEETTLMGLTFGGYLRSKIKCTRCHGKSERQERMMDLTVEIGGDIETLEDALRQFTGTESLDGENKYHCGRCKSYEKAKKKLNILDAPNILTVALKRFQSGKFGKLNKSIRFPEILNLAPYMRGGSDKSPVYRLYGVVVHLDIMNAAFSGHYVCYVRNAQNKWYKIDDSTVKSVELERVLNRGAYMLFYSRISPRAPRSIRSTIISRDLPSKAKTPEVDPSWSNGRSTYPRLRDPSVPAYRSRDDLTSPSYVHQGEAQRSPVRNILDPDTCSDNSSLFSHSDEVSSSTDSNRESISADDFSIFGYNAFFRHSSDSDTSSSSSSSSSSPQYTKDSPLSNSEGYASALSDNGHLVAVGEPSSGGGVSFLHSNTSKQCRKLVNSNSSSSSREADAERLGWANPSDKGKSDVYLRRSRKKTD